jgi:hypothetical protein
VDPCSACTAAAVLEPTAIATCVDIFELFGEISISAITDDAIVATSDAYEAGSGCADRAGVIDGAAPTTLTLVVLASAERLRDAELANPPNRPWAEPLVPDMQPPAVTITSSAARLCGGEREALRIFSDAPRASHEVACFFCFVRDYQINPIRDTHN